MDTTAPTFLGWCSASMRCNAAASLLDIVTQTPIHLQQLVTSVRRTPAVDLTTHPVDHPQSLQLRRHKHESYFSAGYPQILEYPMAAMLAVALSHQSLKLTAATSKS